MSQRGFTRLTTTTAAATLARRFIPLADQLRPLLTVYGLRAYSVMIVRTRWSGGERGIGTESMVSEMRLEPTPKLGDLTSLTETLHSIGIDEVGTVDLTQISGRYTEEQLRGLESGEDELPRDEQVYYEAEFFRTDGGPSTHRRFCLRGTPNYAPGKLSWGVRLERAHEDRTRDGDVR